MATESADDEAVAAKKKAVEELDMELEELDGELARIAAMRKWVESYGQQLQAAAGPGHSKDSSAAVVGMDAKALAAAGDFLAFYGERLAQADKDKLRVQREKKRIGEERSKRADELAVMRRPKSRARRMVTVVVEAPESLGESGEVNVSLELNYIVLNASWTSSYDARFDKAEHALQLTYFGVVTNKTDEDWTNVKMSLSTARPAIGGAPPKLSTQNVRFERPHYDVKVKSKKSFGASRSRSSRRASLCLADEAMVQRVSDFAESESMDSDSDEEMLDPNFVAQASANRKSTSTVFDLARPATVESDGKPHKQTVAIIDLQPLMTYLASPKVSPFSFLKCTTINTSEFPLLAGPMSVFIDGNYVSTSDVRSVSQGESFAMFLGVDESVKIDYKPEKVSKSTSGAGILSSKSKVQVHERLINIINTKDEPINVTLFEQLPLSSDSAIKVELLEPTVTENARDEAAGVGNSNTPATAPGAGSVKLNTANNLEMRERIEAGQRWKVKLSYQIAYPSSKQQPNQAIEFFSTGGDGDYE